MGRDLQCLYEYSIVQQGRRFRCIIMKGHRLFGLPLAPGQCQHMFALHIILFILVSLHTFNFSVNATKASRIAIWNMKVQQIILIFSCIYWFSL